MKFIDADALMEIIRAHDYPLATRHNSIDNGMFTIGIQQAVEETPGIPLTRCGWISISQYRPEADSDTKYLVCCRTAKGLRSINLAWFDGRDWHGMGSMAGVTHWMPLPDLPEVGE